MKYHGVTPFCAANGEFPKKTPTPTKPLTQLFGETMVEICSKNPKAVAITAAMPDGTGLKLLAKERPNQFFDVGIAEQHAVTFAAGLACEGYRPFCAIYSTFLQRAYDQVLHDVCIQNLPVVFVLDRGGLVGADGATHHGVFDFAFLRSIPNLIVMAPKDEVELRQMLLTAAEHTEGPIAIRYPRGDGLGLDVSANDVPVEIGKGEVTLELPKRGRPKVAILGIGNTVRFAESAAEILHHDDNFSVVVVNARFVKPLDRELILSAVEGASLVVTVEDHVVCGGFGSAVAEVLTESGALNGIKLLRLGVPDDFIEHGSQAQLYRECGFDVPGIVDCVRRDFLNRNQRNGRALPQRAQLSARQVGE